MSTIPIPVLVIGYPVSIVRPIRIGSPIEIAVSTIIWAMNIGLGLVMNLFEIFFDIYTNIFYFS